MPAASPLCVVKQCSDICEDTSWSVSQDLIDQDLLFPFFTLARQRLFGLTTASRGRELKVFLREHVEPSSIFKQSWSQARYKQGPMMSPIIILASSMTAITDVRPGQTKPDHLDKAHQSSSVRLKARHW